MNHHLIKLLLAFRWHFLKILPCSGILTTQEPMPYKIYTTFGRKFMFWRAWSKSGFEIVLKSIPISYTNFARASFFNRARSFDSESDTDKPCPTRAQSLPHSLCRGHSHKPDCVLLSRCIVTNDGGHAFRLGHPDTDSDTDAVSIYKMFSLWNSVKNRLYFKILKK